MSKEKIKAFRLISNKKTKIQESGPEIGSFVKTGEDGSIEIIDNFFPSPKPFLEALNSPLAFTNIEKYMKQLKESMRLESNLAEQIKLIKPNKEGKQNES